MPSQAGAFCTTLLDARHLERIVGVCMLFPAGFSLLDSRAGLKTSKVHPTGNSSARNIFVGVLIGFYAGIFGGGANVLIVFALVYISGHTFLNAVVNSKLPNLIIMAASLPIFVKAGYVNWYVALSLTLTTAAGAWFGARLVIDRDNRLLRTVFRILIVLLAVRYLFFA